MGQAGADDAEADVGRVHPVMSQRRRGDHQARSAVHERGWPERRLARPADVQEARAPGAQGVAVDRRQLHGKVVRVLPIDQVVDAVGALAGLEQVAVALAPDQRLERGHPAKRQRPARQPASGRERQHVGAEGLVTAARAALVRVDRVDEGVEHHPPAARCEVQPFHPGGLRLPTGSRGFARRRVGSEPALKRGVLRVVLCEGQASRDGEDRQQRGPEAASRARPHGHKSGQGPARCAARAKHRAAEDTPSDRDGEPHAPSVASFG